MKSKLELLHEETENLISRLPDAEQEDFEGLIRLREEALLQLGEQPSLTDDDQRLLVSIEHHHAKLLGRMVEIRDEASSALDKIQHFRRQKNVYEPSYANESYFIDRKK